MMLFILAAALAIGCVIVAVVRHPDPLRRAAVLRRAGFAVMALSTFFFAAFIVGEAFTDPGGWEAAGLVAAWAVPLAILAVLSWFRPSWAIYVLAALTAAVIGVSIWFAVDPHGWRSFEDQHGPIRAVITFVLVAAIGLLGLKRPAGAGILLLAVGIIPVAVSSLGSFPGFASLSIVSAAPVIAGVLYLAAAHLAARPRPPATRAADQRHGPTPHDVASTRATSSGRPVAGRVRRPGRAGHALARPGGQLRAGPMSAPDISVPAAASPMRHVYQQEGGDGDAVRP